MVIKERIVIKKQKKTSKITRYYKGGNQIKSKNQ